MFVNKKSLGYNPVNMRDLVKWVQTDLTEINERTFDSSVERLQNSAFFANIDNFSEFLHEIIVIMGIRPFSVEIITKLLVSILSKNPEFRSYFVEVFFKELYSCVYNLKYVLFRYLRLFYDAGLITINDLYQYANSPNGAPSEVTGLSFVFFSNEIFKSSEKEWQRFHEYYKYIQNILLMDEIQVLFSYFLPQEQYEGSKIQEYITIGCLRNSINYYLKFDMIEEFMSISTQPLFDFNQVIRGNGFDSPMLFSAPNLLQYAAFFGSEKCFKYLILNKPRFDYMDEEGRDVLHFAIAGGNFEIIRQLVSRFDKISDSIMFSIEFRRYEVFYWAIDQNLYNPNLVLFYSSVYDNIPILEHALSQSITINFSQRRSNEKFAQTSLYSAAIEGNITILRILLEQPQITIDTPVESTPLHGSVKYCKWDSFKILTQIPGININAHITGTDTPLHLAIKFGLIKFVKELFAFPNLDVNAIGSQYRTPMHYAIQYGQLEVAKMLLDHPGFQFFELDNCKYNYPMYAIHWNQLNILESLINTERYDINYQCNSGDTALHVATLVGSKPIIEFLLSINGIRTDIKNHKGRRAMEKTCRI